MSFEEIIHDPAQSIILDYYNIFHKTKLLVATAIISGVLILLSLVYLANLLPLISIQHLEQRNLLLFLLAFVVIGVTGMWLIINSTPLLSWYIFGGRKKKKGLLELQSKIIRRSYLTNFETVTPEGETSADRIFNHLSLVFPQIYEIKLKRIKKGFGSIDVSKKRFMRRISPLRNYDMVMKTVTGFFVVQIFENESSFNEIENTVKALNLQQIGFKMFGPVEIGRVILVLKNKEKINIDEFAEKIKTLDRKFSLDVIHEESELGYSTIWID